MDLHSLNLEDLLQLQQRVEVEIVNRRSAQEQQVLEEIRQKAAQLGLNPEELVTKLQGKAKNTVAPKFRDPASGTLWSGRGRKPLWVEAWLSSGRSIDDLRI